MTNHWVDIKNTDLVLIIGGNAAEAHPCGFKWVTEAKASRKAKLIVIDPRFTRSAAVSDFYAPIRAGTDIALLGGIINYLLSHDKIHHEYVQNYTDFSFLVKDEYGFEDGIFSGYDAEKRKYDKSTWGYQLGDDGFVLTDPTLENPRCVYQMMKALYDNPKEKDAIHPQARQWNLENMFRGAEYTTKYIPFHSGAVKYLKEKGAWKEMK